MNCIKGGTMSKLTNNSEGQEEIIRKIWPPIDPVESVDWEITTWEILNQNSNNPKEDNRHWFKQNYTDQHRVPDSAITYH
jgi:hypothetical protein